MCDKQNGTIVNVDSPFDSYAGWYHVLADGNPRTRGVLVRRITGDSTPYEFPVKPVRLVQEW